MKLSDKLEMLRERSGLSAREVARRIGTPTTTFGRWLSGETEPRLSESVAIAGFFGVAVEYLADDSQDEPRPPMLSVDEEMALRLYRRFRESFEHPADATLALTRFVAVQGDNGAAADKPHGPAKFLSRADLSESDAKRQQEKRKPKKVERKKPAVKGKGR